ncbi:hypothetical protein [Aeromonas veronii]|uniref:Uncharacterized protein n=1 Tax=Aeromonas veronii TaxID=654 RepID=A0A4S5CGS7_AERVE|nr:hypothetical protein [Aeromonas veronii]THJ45047.1 hypothetical protein E8Q35_12745 [Aeromonas veronii]
MPYYLGSSIVLAILAMWLLNALIDISKRTYAAAENDKLTLFVLTIMCCSLSLITMANALPRVGEIFNDVLLWGTPEFRLLTVGIMLMLLVAVYGLFLSGVVLLLRKSIGYQRA